MKSVVMDEGVPRSLVQALREHGVDAHRFPPEWQSLSNGRLLTAVEQAGFACLLTNDRNMAQQTHLRGKAIAVVALPSNRVSVIMGRVRDIAATILQAEPGQHVVMALDGRRTVRQHSEGAVIDGELPALLPFEDPHRSG
jgi:hypothetical protein